MVTKSELQNKYVNLSNAQLLDIIKDGSGYTETAIEVAKEEFDKRNVSENEILKIKEDQQEIEKISFQKKNVDGLTLIQKILFYVVFIPLFTFPFKSNFRDDGYVLKAVQANYYSLFGFVSVFVSVFISMFLKLNDWCSLILWFLLFIPVNYFISNSKKHSLQEI